MLTSPYATPDDVVALFGPITGQEPKVDWLLTRAGAEVRARTTQLDARLAAGTLDEDLVIGVVTAMVVRVLHNPLGKRQVSESIDDFTTSWTVDQAVSSGALYVSDEELAKLAPAPAGLRVGTIRLRSWL